VFVTAGVTKFLARGSGIRCRPAKATKICARSSTPSLQQPVLCLHVSPTDDEVDRFRDYWRRWGDHLPLEVIISPHRALVAPMAMLGADPTCSFVTATVKTVANCGSSFSTSTYVNDGWPGGGRRP
jgi:hypothetical protein